MDELKKACLAGFFDGDGNINIYKRRGKKSPRHCLKITIGQTDNEILNYIKNLIGFGSIYKAHENFWHLNFASKQALIFLKEIIPYLKVKRLEAQFAIQFQENKTRSMNKGRRGGRGLSEEELKWRDMHYWLLRYIKKKRYNR